MRVQEILDNFDDSLSQEDSEVLFSLLTAPYVRMPLVVSSVISHALAMRCLGLEIASLPIAHVPAMRRPALKRECWPVFFAMSEDEVCFRGSLGELCVGC